MGRGGRHAGYLACGAVGISFLASLAALAIWVSEFPLWEKASHEHHGHASLLGPPNDSKKPVSANHSEDSQANRAGNLVESFFVESFWSKFSSWRAPDSGGFAWAISSPKENAVHEPFGLSEFKAMALVEPLAGSQQAAFGCAFVGVSYSGGQGVGSYGGEAVGRGLSARQTGTSNQADNTTQIGARPHALVTGDWYTLAEFGNLRLTIGYYIDALTVAMFVMITLVATCIHVYSLAYMHEELAEVTDPLVLGEDCKPIRRPGRFPRFFQYLSLFCFSMLGLVLANNLAMVFAFWELVGICSYLLIGFYWERPSANYAATKAFVVNRVGDFGMLVGLAAFWGALGTLHFNDSPQGPGIFSHAQACRAIDTGGSPTHGSATAFRDQTAVIQASLKTADSEVLDRSGHVPSMGQFSPAVLQVELHGHDGSFQAKSGEQSYGLAAAGDVSTELTYGLLLLAGLGIFCGCVGKSAQFPLHVWLPDAMEGPTPVSALIHAATMVAAGVYLVGRFYPAFPPEVVLVIAYVGAVTLLLAASMALVATDIKRVLAYSTVSQLGFMMLALGVGGWAAGLFHLLTHAFFKALLFLGAGSVIHACHTNEMTSMGGLRHKMPWTAGTMLVGCLAIAGAGVPMWVGLSGFHSKDAMIAQLCSLARFGGLHGQFLLAAAVLGTCMTAFYMFRLWFKTFAGIPRDPHRWEHAHESPRLMVGPLVVLAFFSIVAGWTVPGSSWGIMSFLEQARAPVIANGISPGLWWPAVVLPPEYLSHEAAIHHQATWLAFGAALIGFLGAVMLYGWRVVTPAAFARLFLPLYVLFQRKWYLDELYETIFVRPALALASVAAWFDRVIIDGLIDGFARVVTLVARLEDLLDRWFVDGAVNLIAAGVFRLGLLLRRVQTGLLRQYVMVVVLGTVALFALVHWLWVSAG